MIKIKKYLLILVLLIFSFCILQNKAVNAQEFKLEKLEEMTAEKAPIEEQSFEVIKNDDSEVETESQQSITVIKNEFAPRYIIQSGDVLSFSVYDEPDFTQPEIIVRPDGYATIQPVGEIFVADLDLNDLTSILEKRMLAYVNEPQVFVNIREFNPASFYIFGAVQKPGAYQQIIQFSRIATSSQDPSVKLNLTISNILSNSGGINHDADLTNIQVTNKIGEQKIVNLLKFLKDGDISQDIILTPGDAIFVPKVETILYGDTEFKIICAAGLFPEKFPVRVLGEVNTPGIYYVTSDTPYLNSAVAMAQGYRLSAKKKAVLIHRKNFDDKTTKIVINPRKVDFMLRPNDIIEIKDRKIIKIANGADYVSRFLAPFYGIPNVFNTWAEVFNPNRRYQRD